MTIQQTLSEFASWPRAEKSSASDLQRVRIIAPGGAEFLHTRSPGKTASGTSAEIFNLEFFAPAGDLDSDSEEFDSFLKEIEATGEGAKHSQDARRWIAQSFYGDKPETLASLRLRTGLSQAQLADACGLQQPHVSRYEAGRTEPQLQQAARMAQVLQVTLDQFCEAFINSKNQAVQ